MFNDRCGVAQRSAHTVRDLIEPKACPQKARFGRAAGVLKAEGRIGQPIRAAIPVTCDRATSRQSRDRVPVVVRKQERLIVRCGVDQPVQFRRDGDVRDTTSNRSGFVGGLFRLVARPCCRFPEPR